MRNPLVSIGDRVTVDSPVMGVFVGVVVQVCGEDPQCVKVSYGNGRTTWIDPHRTRLERWEGGDKR